MLTFMASQWTHLSSTTGVLPMKTVEGIYKNGKVQLKGSSILRENHAVYVLIPDAPRQTGIDPGRNDRISEAKRAARSRIRAGKARVDTD